MLLFPGFGQTHAPWTRSRSRTSRRKGFASLTCDERGTGTSGGTFDLAGPTDAQDVAGDSSTGSRRGPTVSDTEIGAYGEDRSAVRRSGTQPSRAFRSRRSSPPRRGRASRRRSKPTGVVNIEPGPTPRRRRPGDVEHRVGCRGSLLPCSSPVAHRPDADLPRPRRPPLGSEPGDGGVPAAHGSEAALRPRERRTASPVRDRGVVPALPRRRPEGRWRRRDRARTGRVHDEVREASADARSSASTCRARLRGAACV